MSLRGFSSLALALVASACAATQQSLPARNAAPGDGPPRARVPGPPLEAGAEDHGGTPRVPPGHPPVTGKGLPPGHPPLDRPSADAKPEKGPSLDDPGPTAEAWRRPYFLVDGRTGERLDDAALDARLAKSRVIYIGEKHDAPAHHQVQLEILERAARLGTVAVGLEMIQRPFQPALDVFMRDRDEAALTAGVEWESRWGYDFRLYRPIFRWAVERGIPLVALNARKELTRAVARKGLEGIPAELRSELPKLDLSHPAHRTRIGMVFAEHVAPHGGLELDDFYAAQVVWDETMAETVARALGARSSPQRMVVLAGAGHVRYGEGIPQRAARRGARPALTILPLELSEGVSLVGSGIADVLWVFEAEGGPSKTPLSAATREDAPARPKSERALSKATTPR